MAQCGCGLPVKYALFADGHRGLASGRALSLIHARDWGTLAKSLVSRSGCLEFAKRFLIHQVSKDISPVNVKMVRGAN